MGFACMSDGKQVLGFELTKSLLNAVRTQTGLTLGRQTRDGAIEIELRQLAETE